MYVWAANKESAIFDIIRFARFTIASTLIPGHYSF